MTDEQATGLLHVQDAPVADAATRYHVLINGKSGAVLQAGQDNIREAIAQSGLLTESIEFLEGDDFRDKMNAYVNSPHPLMVGGGDGTICMAAAAHLSQDKPMAVLPFGTMNLLAQDLGVPVPWHNALEAYAQGVKAIKIDVSYVNDEPFLCCAAIGTMPEAAQLREQHRKKADILMLPRLTAFVMERLDRKNSRLVYLTLDGRRRRHRTSSLVISNNRFSAPAPAEGKPGGFKRSTLQDGVMGVYSILPAQSWDKVRLMMRLLSGHWRRDPAVREYKAHNLRIDARDGSTDVLISLDGEPMKKSWPLVFTVKPRILKVLVPVATPDTQK